MDFTTAPLPIQIFFIGFLALTVILAVGSIGALACAELFSEE